MEDGLGFRKNGDWKKALVMRNIIFSLFALSGYPWVAWIKNLCFEIQLASGLSP